MKNKVLLISLAVVLALSLSIVGCAGEQEEEEGLNLVFSDHNPSFNPMAQAMVAYAYYIGNHTTRDDVATVNVRVGAALALDTELFEYAQLGTVDGGSYVPEIGDGIIYGNVLNLPFLGLPGDEYDVVEIYDTLVSEYSEIQQEYTDQGVYMAGIRVMPPVHFHFHANQTIVDEPSDLSGMSIISLEGLGVAMLEQLGATGVQLGFMQLFDALTSPYLTDGFVNHYAILGGFGWIYELKSHTEVGEGGIWRQPLGILWNKDSWDALIAAGYGDMLDDAYDVWLDVAITGTFPDIDTAEAVMTANNHTVTELTPSQIDAFAAEVEGIYAAWKGLAPSYTTADAVFNRTLELAAGP